MPRQPVGRGLRAALGVGETLGWSKDNSADLPQQVLSAELAASRARFVAAMDDDLNTSAALAELFDLAKPLRGLAGRLRTVEASQYVLSQIEQNLRQRWQLLVELAGEVLGLVVTPNHQPLGLDVGASALADVDASTLALTGAAAGTVGVSGVTSGTLPLAGTSTGVIGNQEAKPASALAAEKIGHEKNAHEKIINELLQQRWQAKSQKDYAKADQLRHTLINEYKVEIFDKKAGITTATGGVLQQTVVSFDPATRPSDSPDTSA